MTEYSPQNQENFVDPARVIEKFGAAYSVDAETFVMGIHHRLATRIAERFRGHQLVLDACSGAGFMTIPLVASGVDVIAVNISSSHLDQTEVNVSLAGVANKVRLIQGDVLEPAILEKVRDADAVFLDPDWAKPGDVKTLHVTTLDDMEPNGRRLIQTFLAQTPNIAFRFPREIDRQELQSLPEHELEEAWLDNDLKFLTAYFGDLRQLVGISRLEVQSSIP